MSINTINNLSYTNCLKIPGASLFMYENLVKP